MDASTDQWLAARHHAVLITIRRDGTPQSSNLSYTYAGGVARVSVTADRAKTRNLRRDPRGVLHVLGDSFWQYASVAVDAELGEVTAEPGDAAGRELLEVYNAISDEPHPDETEYFASMVEQHRLVLSLRVRSVTAMGLPA